MELLKAIFYFLFDYSFLKKKEAKGKKVGWIDVLFPPTIRIAILLGLLLGFIAIIAAYLGDKK